MAGHGPAPSTNRRRRNAPTRGEWVDLAPLADPVLPELPEEHPFPAASVEMYEGWRADPVTALWTSSDRAFAFDTLRLHASNPAAHASEIRLRMDSLGLTQKGKRDNRWRVVEAPADEAAPAPAPRPARLRAV
jgi:hypothetical protein